jgi:death-on-curing protein
VSARVRALTLEEALAIHEASLERFGGLPGLRDEGLLESALAQPFQTFGGAELYPTFAEKAARYAYGIARNHPFLDGNKRRHRLHGRLPAHQWILIQAES